MNPSSKQQNWLHRNPAGSRRTQQLGSGKPSKAGFDETQQGSSEPNLAGKAGFDETQQGSSEPSKGNPARLGSTRPSRVRRNPAKLGSRRPNLAGFDGTQQIWVSSNPAWLGFPCWVPTRPSRMGATRSSRLGSSQPSEVETQGRKERKRKKEGEEEGLGG
ncbi:hypothetical protein SLEP1_g30372 [Rubroshorea leprosula]|uniref:Uncharacterized protein n=1 Tax=Rubroshorea leprosula TaxID=152421 RepID=A0AAV5JZW4_9ROSI|nr:hypothetical protein SLEP1_g30372 [Rubroshorea leprosula]